MFIIYSLPNYNKHGKFNKILPKVATSSSAIISRRGDTNMAESSDTDLQVVTRGQLQLILD